MKPFRTAVCLSVLLVGWCQAASAQSQFAIVFDLYSPPEALRKVTKDALDTPFGKAMLAGFAEAVAKTADSACLSSRKLDSATLADRGRDIFQRYGTSMLATFARMVDRKAYRTALSARGGRNAAAELDRLTKHPDIVRLMEIVRPARLATVATLLFENFDRYNLITRGTFPPLSPYSNESLAAQDPTDAAMKEGLQFIESRDSPELRRFVDLSFISREAKRTSENRSRVMASGPADWFRGVDKDLAALCVPRTSR